ncbi:DUF4174 domain-containing protein [Candidatus Pelagibacter sp.]|nr:DUF4174 domain-containing protein [Candidatus Pelagibacter sp.]
MNFKKYLKKCRLLVLNTPNYSHSEYKRSKDLYQKDIKGFHKRYIKLITKLDKSKKFKVILIDFDGRKKNESDKLYTKKIFEIVDKMPMNKFIKDRNFKPLNLSLFSDYKPETTLKGLGFKDKAKALFTVSAIKKRPIKYQVNVIATMLGRAKNHPNKTKDMSDAIVVFNKWMENYKITKKNEN